jgi:hypothetical protein
MTRPRVLLSLPCGLDTYTIVLAPLGSMTLHSKMYTMIDEVPNPSTTRISLLLSDSATTIGTPPP